MGLMFSTVVKGGMADRDLHLDIERTTKGIRQDWDDPGSPAEYVIHSACIHHGGKTLWIPSCFNDVLLESFEDHINDAALDAEQAGD